MAISFAIEEVSNYLISYGEVYTVRNKRKSLGRDWWNIKRGTKKIGNCRIVNQERRRY